MCGNVFIKTANTSELCLESLADLVITSLHLDNEMEKSRKHGVFYFNLYYFIFCFNNIVKNDKKKNAYRKYNVCIKWATWKNYILFILSKNDRKNINVKHMQQIGYMENLIIAEIENLI